VASEAKSSTLRFICKEIDDQGYTSNPQLSSELNISLPTAINYSKQLIDAGLLLKDGKCPSTGGKRADKLIFNPKYKLSLGLDIKQQEITLVAVDFAYQVVREHTFALTFAWSHDYFVQVQRCIEQFVRSLPQDCPLNTCLGVSVPGTVNHDQSFSSYALRLNDKSYDLRELGELTQFQLKLLNDSNAGAIAETRSYKRGSFVYLNLSRTVGSGIVAEGKLLLGINARAGEVGHMTLFAHGRSCYCGRDGCADPYLNEAALLKDEFTSLDNFFANVVAGTPTAVSRFNQYLEALALLINNLNNFCDTNIILGGTIGPFLYLHLDKLNELVNANALYDSKNLILDATVTSAPAAYGAALASRRTLYPGA